MGNQRWTQVLHTRGTNERRLSREGSDLRSIQEFFLGRPASEYRFLGYDTSSLIPGKISYSTADVGEELSAAGLDGEPFTPTLSPKSELVLFVGYPSMGKSTLYRKHFGPAGYEHISQDALGTRAKCTKATGEVLASGKSCVVGKLPSPATGPLTLLPITPPSRQHEQGRANTETLH